MKEENIDCMKYRKSTHIAGVDVEMKRGKNDEPFIVTIKNAFYDTKVDVSGNKTDGYFLEFEEKDVKPMVVNSINRKTIAFILQEGFGMSTLESRNIGNWNGLKIELTYDPSVKMMGKVVGGIRIAPTIFKKPELNTKSEKWDGAKKAILNGTTRSEIEKHYTVTDKNWELLTQTKTKDEK
jgi:hypothetical protein